MYDKNNDDRDEKFNLPVLPILNPRGVKLASSGQIGGPEDPGRLCYSVTRRQ